MSANTSTTTQRQDIIDMAKYVHGPGEYVIVTLHAKDKQTGSKAMREYTVLCYPKDGEICDAVEGGDLSRLDRVLRQRMASKVSQDHRFHDMLKLSQEHIARWEKRHESKTEKSDIAE